MKNNKLQTKIFLASAIIFAFIYQAVYRVSALSISAHISDQSTEVLGGDRLYFDIEIKYPENDRRKDLRVEYQILENGQAIASEKVLRAVETQASFLDYVVVPKNAKGGIHDLNVSVSDYGDLHQDVSATFKIIKGMNQMVMYFYVLIFAVIIIILFVAVQVRIMLKFYKNDSSDIHPENKTPEQNSGINQSENKIIEQEIPVQGEPSEALLSDNGQAQLFEDEPNTPPLAMQNTTQNIINNP